MATIELAIFVGLQAAGKTSFYRNRLSHTHRHVSKDLLRNARNRQARQLALIEQALAEGASVAVDNTNPRIADRAPLIWLGRDFGAKIIGYCFTATAAECLERNAGREGRNRVPDVAIYATRRILEWPARVEGFDALFQVRLGSDGFVVEPLPEDR